MYKNKKEKLVKKEEFEWEMSINARKLFNTYITEAVVYLEFGSGGSTIATLTNMKGKVYSVE
jgi:hypothetical protein